MFTDEEKEALGMVLDAAHSQIWEYDSFRSRDRLVVERRRKFQLGCELIEKMIWKEDK